MRIYYFHFKTISVIPFLSHLVANDTWPIVQLTLVTVDSLELVIMTPTPDGVAVDYWQNFWAKIKLANLRSPNMPLWALSRTLIWWEQGASPGGELHPNTMRPEIFLSLDQLIAPDRIWNITSNWWSKRLMSNLYCLLLVCNSIGEAYSWLA